MKKAYLLLVLFALVSKSFSAEVGAYIYKTKEVETPFLSQSQNTKKDFQDEFPTTKKSQAESDAEFQKNIDKYCGKVKSKALPPNPSECLKLVLQQLEDINYPNMANKKGSKPGHADSFCTPDSAEKECQAPDGRVYKLDNSGNQLGRALSSKPFPSSTEPKGNKAEGRER